MRAVKARGICGALAVALTLTAAHGRAQSPAPPQAEPQTQPQPDSTQPNQKLLFERSTDADGQTTEATPGKTGPGQSRPTTPPAATATAATTADTAALAQEDAQRAAESVTDYDMDVRLEPAAGHIAVRSLLVVHNTGSAPLAAVRLQLSSQLNWEIIRLVGRSLQFTTETLNSDADHTGQLHEAVLPLAAPLAPGASLQLDVTYSGTVAQSARRLLALGTPQSTANDSDWDRITLGFTGLRGFGNVVWYPVASVPVILGDGNRLFDEIGEHKQQLAGSHFALNLTLESPAGEAPTIALVNGHPIALTTTTSADASVAQVSTGRVSSSAMGFEAPSLFVATRASHALANATVWTRPEDGDNVAAWAAAADRVSPFLAHWLGPKPRAELTVLELPEDTDAPFETGALFAAPVRAAAADVLDGVMAHALTHAWVQSPRAWLSEGVAHFMGTLWMEKQQGREHALSALDSGRSALALAEPASPGESDGQPLIRATSPVYYRTKAAYVLWMLRDMVGDDALAAALTAYNPATDTAPDSFEKLLEQAGPRHDLRWFFNDWVYADKGLPELVIDSVFPAYNSTGGSWLVAANLSNNGYAACEVPMTLIGEHATASQRVILPARGHIVQRMVLATHPSELRLNDGTVPEAAATIHSKLLDDGSLN